MSSSHALRTSRGRRRFVTPATAVPALAVPVLFLAVAVPAWAQTPGSGYGRTGEAAGAVLTNPLTTSLGIVAVVASAVVAGTTALGFLSPPSRRSVLVVQGGAAIAVPVLVINWLIGGLTALATFPQAAGVLVAAVMFARGCQTSSAVLGLLLIGALGYNATVGHVGWHVGLAAVHMVAAVTWLGSAVSVATPACGARFTVLRRHTLVFAISATVAVAAAALEAVAKGMRFDGVTFGSLTGQLVIVQALGMTVAISTGLCRPGAIGGRVVAVAAGLVFTAGTVIAVQTPAPVPADTGRPLLRTVALAGQDVPVVVVPQRPGRNLVHVGVPGAMVGGVSADERAGAPGGWAVVDLPADTDVLTVEADGEQVPLRLDLGSDPAPPALVAGLAGPDGPECLSAVVGGMVRGVTDLPTACPSDALSAQDAVALRATVRFLADRDVALYLVSDGSGRSKAAATVVRDAAAAHGLTVDDRLNPADAVVVVAGWEGGGRRLTDELFGRSTVGGTYTAPWLATGSVLGRRTSAVTTLDFDPRAVPAQRYLADLRAAGVTLLASPAGFREWSAPTDRGEPNAAPRIFTAVQVAVIPAAVGGTDHRTTAPWLPGGALTPVTPPLPQ
ncbi:hypothetical protein ACQPZQ_07615 [Pseudonocardia sp. CA-142604]|uniref:hypothetical protein n=1 Tax=Pseudonocardia sp. CA-142604 TaxID=3240024 RepID=UPI003D8E01FE